MSDSIIRVEAFGNDLNAFLDAVRRASLNNDRLPYVVRNNEILFVVFSGEEMKKAIERLTQTGR